MSTILIGINKIMVMNLCRGTAYTIIRMIIEFGYAFQPHSHVNVHLSVAKTQKTLAACQRLHSDSSPSASQLFQNSQPFKHARKFLGCYGFTEIIALYFVASLLL